MEALYEAFCAADPDFYDRRGHDLTDEALFPPVREAVAPDGWRRIAEPAWVYYQPPGVHLPAQGWKVHVSAAVDRSAEVVQVVYDYCVARSLTFKVVPGAREYQRRNAKYAERAGSGKLATIYPLDEQHLHTTVTDLGELLDGTPGPYILSDLRWAEGPVYVRYGAFAPRTLTGPDGRETVAVEDVDGNLVPDARGPVFSVPDWVQLPSFLKPDLDRRNATRVDQLPFEIVSALHYSNGGGVYEGRMRTDGEKVAVKEGRPYAGVDREGRDAVTRVRRERDILRHLAGLPAVAELKGCHSAAGHEFLVEEFVAGEPLFTAAARRNPLVDDVPPSPERLAAFRDWAMSVWERVAEAVADLHQRGVVFGDLHLYNILCPTQDEEAAGARQVRLIDFEAGWFVEEGGRQVMANPGFGAPRDRTGTDVDLYALAALKLAIFAPLTSLIPLNPAKAAQLAGVIADRYDVPPGWFADALETLTGRPSVSPLPCRVDFGPAAWAEVRSSITAAIAASRSPERDDRVFPGDIAQFLHSDAGLGLAHGAAGVLWALRTAGACEVPAAERWLLDRVHREEPDGRAGLYNGRHGIAYALWELGHRDAAVDLLARLPRAATPDTDLSLTEGLAGIGLNWLHFARVCDDDQYLKRALATAERVHALIGDVADVAETSGGAHPHAGLMQGSAGPALFLTTLYEETGDTRHLDAAATALRQDLRRCAHSEGGTRAEGRALFVNEGFRLMPYLAAGSAGIGIALDRYMTHRQEPEFVAALAAIRRAVVPSFCPFPGLFGGAAGLLLFNAHHAVAPGTAARQAHILDWHVLHWRGRMAFPGTNLLRMSMDLATGGAGVLLALAAVNEGERKTTLRPSLPFLLPPEPQVEPSGPSLSPATATPERR
ncbi:class III lanthionine synthetase LanKC [Streptomyces aureoverticillatus]|uniref:class III lanthionine synthetase LanKC n=1 Tax=Streptomyces aureoverticillatus TaxID=66871 RepID=UPI0013DC3ABA|nr:class III lanthionine synthetase LanKC [Streptomyces aureoverticillatus]QIB41755.1 lantipeptide synthetase [Streptomyces aureoverticillatus]